MWKIRLKQFPQKVRGKKKPGSEKIRTLEDWSKQSRVNWIYTGVPRTGPTEYPAHKMKIEHTEEHQET